MKNLWPANDNNIPPVVGIYVRGNGYWNTCRHLDLGCFECAECRYVQPIPDGYEGACMQCTGQLMLKREFSRMQGSRVVSYSAHSP